MMFRTLRSHFPVALGIGLALAFAPMAHAGTAQFGGNIEKISLVLDKTAGGSKLLPERDRRRLAKVFNNSVVYLNLKVLLDGSDANAVETRIEESTVPEPAPCGINNYGRMTMKHDVEYIVESAYKFNGDKVYMSASIFPGERTEFPYNDVSCNFYASNNQATFEVTGFYYIHINTVKDGFEVQLRPITPEFSIAAKILNKSPLAKLEERINIQSGQASERVKKRIGRFRKGVRSFMEKF